MNPFTGVQNNTFGTLDACGSGQGGRRRALRARVERQGGAPDQCHGGEQAACRADPSGARRAAGGRAARRRHHLHHGALRQCARFVRLGGAALPQSDPGWRPGDRHPPRDHPLFHVDPRGRPARDPGRRHGERRRGVRARHGHAGEDRRSRPHHGAPVGPRSARREQSRRRHRHRVYRACGAARSSTRSS